MKNTLTKVREKIEILKPAEKRVAEYVLQNPYVVIESTITQVAEATNVSEPTVVRFCRKIELKGYTELRLNLARDMPPPKYTYETVADDDSPVKILEKIFTCHYDGLFNAFKKIDLHSFTKAADLLRSAKQIDFYGFGGSGLIAQEAWHKFFRLGIPCNTYKDAQLHLIGASLLKPDSVVIALTISAASIDIVEAVKVARKTGAKIIGVTGKDRTPMDRYCDVVIPLVCREPIAWFYSFSCRLAQIALLDALLVAMALEKNGKLRENLNKIQESLLVKFY